MGMKHWEYEYLDYRGTDFKMQQRRTTVVIAFIALHWFQGGFGIAPLGDELESFDFPILGDQDPPPKM